MPEIVWDLRIFMRFSTDSMTAKILQRHIAIPLNQLLQDKTWSSIAKWIWAVVSVGMNLLGVLLYLLFGRGKGKYVCKEDNLPVV